MGFFGSLSISFIFFLFFCWFFYEVLLVGVEVFGGFKAFRVFWRVFRGTWMSVFVDGF